MKIDDMPAGRELDALVAARVIGWQDLNQNATQVGMLFDLSGEWMPLRKYSTDIAAAWELVEKLESRSVTFNLHHLPRCTWDVNFVTHPAGSFLNPVYHDSRDSATAPHAICIAALKAVGVEEVP